MVGSGLGEDETLIRKEGEKRRGEEEEKKGKI